MKKKIGLWAGVILLAAGGWGIWKWIEKKNEPPPFREVQASRGDLEIMVLATGIVKPENRLELKPPIAGRVESILVEEGQSVKRGQILAWLSSSERAALLDAARAKGSTELAHWEDLFKPTPLLAPLSGLIIVKNVVPGQAVTAADSVLVMSDHLIVNTQVDETDIGQVKLGQKVSITLDAYPGREIPGVVTRLAFESKTVNNVTIYEVQVLPDHVPDFMKSGMTANVKFIVKERKGVLLLPAQAVRQEEKKTSVLLPNPEGGPPKKQEVTVGSTDGKNIEILSGLQEGEAVLLPVFSKKKNGTGTASTPISPFGRTPRPR